MTPLTLVLDAAAAWRLTRLVTDDSFPPVQKARDAVIAWATEREKARLGISAGTIPPPPLAELVSCPYCASVWIAGGVLVLRRFLPRQWDPVARLLAVAAVVAVVATWESGITEPEPVEVELRLVDG